MYYVASKLQTRRRLMRENEHQLLIEEKERRHRSPSANSKRLTSPSDNIVNPLIRVRSTGSLEELSDRELLCCLHPISSVQTNLTKGPGRHRRCSSARRPSRSAKTVVIIPDSCGVTNVKLTGGQIRALAVTGKKLSSYGSSSQVGLTRAMQKVFEKCTHDHSQMELMFRTSCSTNIFHHSEILKLSLLTLANRVCNYHRSNHQSFIQTAPTKTLSAYEIGEAHATLFTIATAKSGFSNFNLDRGSTKGYCGSAEQLWDKFGENLIDTLFGQECINAFPQAADAWRRLIVCFIEDIKSGHKAANRLRFANTAAADGSGSVRPNLSMHPSEPSPQSLQPNHQLLDVPVVPIVQPRKLSLSKRFVSTGDLVVDIDSVLQTKRHSSGEC